MLRRFRTWLADVIRPADVQTDPAPVVVAAEQPVAAVELVSNDDAKISIDDYEISRVQELALNILEDRFSHDGHVIRQTKSGHATKSVQLIKTKVFADMINMPENQIIKWKNGVSKPPSSMPKYIRSNEKAPTMWYREECLVFAYIYSRSIHFKDCLIDVNMLAGILGTTYASAYAAGKHWHARNKTKSSWHNNVNDGRRLLRLSHAIEIGLERAGLAV